MTEGRPTILLVEDDDVDAMLFERRTTRRDWDVEIVRARNGREALERLRSDDKSAIRHPSLIILDLNMPVMGGIEFLAAIRNDPVLTDRVVFVLTTSSHPRDVAAAFAHQVAGYTLKDVDETDRFGRFLDLIEAYFETMHFPQ